MTEEGHLYGGLARYYDQIYHWKDYQKEALKIKHLIKSYKRSAGTSLLDVACGTGAHIRYLLDEFNCVGIDTSEKMLAVARKNAPAAEFVKANMLDFNLGRQFDVVLCLFSSIGHLRTRSEIGKALTNFSRHMRGGGVCIIEPWVKESDWRDKAVNLHSYESDSLKITSASFGQKKGRFSIIDERYLIAERGKGITYVRDRLKLRLFELDETMEAARKAGLKPTFTNESLTSSRGLLIATK
jgi:ubiquinone/menaquinone biosynthesis C-methylase UbiE